jgi:hypothetical protein
MMAGLSYAVILFVWYSLNHNLIECYQGGRDVSDQERSYILQSRFRPGLSCLNWAGRSCAVQSCEARVDSWLWAFDYAGTPKEKATLLASA